MTHGAHRTLTSSHAQWRSQTPSRASAPSMRFWPLGASIRATSFSTSPPTKRAPFSRSLRQKAAHDRGRSEPLPNPLPNLAPLVDSRAAAPVASSASSLLRSWFEANYTRIPLREKDTGIKLEALYSSYTSATPPVHQKLLGKIKFAQMMGATYQNIGPHRASSGNSGGLYLARRLRAP